MQCIRNEVQERLVLKPRAGTKINAMTKRLFEEKAGLEKLMICRNRRVCVLKTKATIVEDVFCSDRHLKALN